MRDEFMTDEGIRIYELVKSYELGMYYNEFAGNILIPEFEMNTEILIRVTAFLRNNEEWVLGYENCDGEEGVWYLNTRDCVN
jgi:hypothetical protein